MWPTPLQCPWILCFCLLTVKDQSNSFQVSATSSIRRDQLLSFDSEFSSHLQHSNHCTHQPHSRPSSDATSKKLFLSTYFYFVFIFLYNLFHSPQLCSPNQALVCTAFRALNAPLLKDNYLSCQDLPPNPFLTKHLLPISLWETGA